MCYCMIMFTCLHVANVCFHNFYNNIWNYSNRIHSIITIFTVIHKLKFSKIKNKKQTIIIIIILCVAAPEDPPQSVVFRNITSKSLSLSWDPPKIITGRFSYIIQLHSSEGNTC